MRKQVLSFFLIALLLPFTGCASRPITSGQSPTNSIPAPEKIPETQLPKTDTSDTSEEKKIETEENTDENRIADKPEEADSIKKVKTEEKPGEESFPLSPEKRNELYRQFLKGALLKEAGKYKDASIAFSSALEITPDSPLLGTLASETLLQSKRVDEAIQVAEQTIQLASSHADSYLVLGKAYAAKKQWDKAINYYNKALQFEPCSLETLDELAQLYLKSKQYDEAIAVYRRITEIVPEQAVIFRLLIADILLKLNRLEEAKTEFQEVAKKIPHYLKVHLSIGRINYLLKNFDEAIENFLTALNYTRTPKDEMAIRRQLGELYRDRQSFIEAIHQYERIKELNPEDLKAREALASLYIEVDQYEEAFQEVDALAKKAPDDFQIQLLCKEILEQLNRGDEAYESFLTAFQYAIDHQNQSSIMRYIWKLSTDESLKSLSDYDFLGRFDDLLEKTKNTPPKIPRIYFARARVAQFTHSPELKDRLRSILNLLEETEAAGDERTAETISIEMRLWYRVRYAFHQEGLSLELADLLQKCRKVFPQNTNLIRAAGIVYSDRNEWQLAESAYTEVMDILEKESSAFKDCLFQLAYVYDKMDRIADVEQLMEEAMRLYPDDPQAYNFLGYTYADRNIHLEKALSLIEKALKNNPNDGNFIDSLGWVYFRLGNYQEAIIHLKRALELEEDHPVILEHLGDAYEENGQYDNAITYWKKALKAGPHYPTEFTKEFKLRVDKKIQSAKSISRQ